MKYICFCIFVTLFYVSEVNGNDSQCGDWQTYKREKCIKIFDTEKLVTFEDAIECCSQIDNSSELLTIHSKEEQDFISEYLFETNKLVDYVWIGLRNCSKNFEWIDFSNRRYTYWRAGNPINKPDFNCVQLESGDSQWTNEPCHKRNLVVCQKLPEITLSDLFKQFLETKADLKEALEKLEKAEETRNQLNNIFDVVFNSKVSHYHFFTDLNGKNKSFIIPLSAMTSNYTFDDSVNLCKTFNSTLIEVQSLEKQTLLESFLTSSGFQSNQEYFIWINGERDSSGKWKWLESNSEFTFINWYSGYPKTSSDYNYVAVGLYSSYFGKWMNSPKSSRYRVVCEYTLQF